MLQVATPLPSHRGGSFVCAKSMGSNGLSEESESFSNQVPWCSSSAKLAVHRPKRTLIPSKYKLSPYMIPQSKIIVSRLEADMYDVVLKMAENEHSKWVINGWNHVFCVFRKWHLNEVIMICFHLFQSLCNWLWACGCQVRCTCKFSKASRKCPLLCDECIV